MHALKAFDDAQLKSNIPDFKAGDRVRVHCKIKEGEKERIQIYEGDVIARHNSGIRSSFIVRKTSYGIGVERIFPLHSPMIEKLEVSQAGQVRRAKLYYLRELSGKKARIKPLDTRIKAAKVAKAAADAAAASEASGS